MTRIYAMAGIALVVLFSAWLWHVDQVKAAVDAARAEMQAQIDKDRAETERDARAMEAAHRAELAAVATKYDQELINAQSRADAVVSDLRAGTERLRRQWLGCENAAARVPATSDAAGELDAIAELRNAAAGRIVRIGAQCDAQVRGLQAALMVCTATSRGNPP